MRGIEKEEGVVMLIHQEITDKIFKAFFEVHRILGYGFLQRVYENALSKELVDAGLKIRRQHPVSVKYKAEVVGEYCTDILVEDLVIVELKAAEGLRGEHESQLLNYLRATGIEVGLLLNFGRKPQFKRLVFTHSQPAS